LIEKHGHPFPHSVREQQMAFSGMRDTECQTGYLLLRIIAGDIYDAFNMNLNNLRPLLNIEWWLFKMKAI
jgi:hypothetical protein